MEHAADILNVTLKKLEFITDSLGSTPDGDAGLVAILGDIEADLRQALDTL